MVAISKPTGRKEMLRAVIDGVSEIQQPMQRGVDDQRQDERADDDQKVGGLVHGGKRSADD